MEVDDKNRHAFRFLCHLIKGCGACQQNHEVRVLDSRDPNLLAVDHIAVALFDCSRLNLGGVRARGRLGDSH